MNSKVNRNEFTPPEEALDPCRWWNASRLQPSQAEKDTLSRLHGLSSTAGIDRLLSTGALSFREIHGEPCWVVGEQPNTWLNTQDAALAYRADGQRWPGGGLALQHPQVANSVLAGQEQLRDSAKPTSVLLAFGLRGALRLATHHAGSEPFPVILVAATATPSIPDALESGDHLTIHAPKGREGDVAAAFGGFPCEAALVEGGIAA